MGSVCIYRYIEKYLISTNYIFSTHLCPLPPSPAIDGVHLFGIHRDLPMRRFHDGHPMLRGLAKTRRASGVAIKKHIWCLMVVYSGFTMENCDL